MSRWTEQLVRKKFTAALVLLLSAVVGGWYALPYLQYRQQPFWLFALALIAGAIMAWAILKTISEAYRPCHRDAVSCEPPLSRSVVLLLLVPAVVGGAFVFPQWKPEAAWYEHLIIAAAGVGIWGVWVWGAVLGVPEAITGIGDLFKFLTLNQSRPPSGGKTR